MFAARDTGRVRENPGDMLALTIYTHSWNRESTEEEGPYWKERSHLSIHRPQLSERDSRDVILSIVQRSVPSLHPHS